MGRRLKITFGIAGGLAALSEFRAWVPSRLSMSTLAYPERLPGSEIERSGGIVFDPCNALSYAMFDNDLVRPEVPRTPSVADM